MDGKFNKNDPDFQQKLDEIYSILMATFDWMEYSNQKPNYYDYRNTIESHRADYIKYYQQNLYQSILKGFDIFAAPYFSCFDTLFEAYILKQTGAQINVLAEYPSFEIKIYEIVKKGKVSSTTRYEDAQKMIDFILLNGHQDITLLPNLRKITNDYIEKIIKNNEKHKGFPFTGQILTVHAVV